MKLKYGQPVQVTWVDACGGSGWKEPFEDGIEVVSVGILVKQNKKGYCLASGVDPSDKELVLAPGWVPKGMVKSIRKLR
jgi:hypothetical protein